MKKSLFSLICLSFLVSGCILWWGNSYPYENSRHVVRYYTIAPWEPVTKGMFHPLEDSYWSYAHLTEVSYFAGGDEWIPIDHVIEMHIQSRMDNGGSLLAESLFITSDNKSEAYEELCRKHGDTKRSPIGAPYRDYAYYYKDMEDFTVTSTEDFDPQHPAGSSLLDILHFAVNSPYRILKNKYEMLFDEDVLLYDPEQCRYRPSIIWSDYKGISRYAGQVFNTYKRGDQVGKDDLTVLGNFFIIFDKLPDPVGPRTIQIRLTDESGVGCDYEVQLTFEKVPGCPISLQLSDDNWRSYLEYEDEDGNVYRKY